METRPTNPLQRDFAALLGGDAGFPRLFDHLERVAFFLKDSHFRFVFANRYFFGRFGFTEEAEIVGKDDFEIFPRPLAAKFREDDEAVLRTGQPMPRMVELFLSRQGLPDWFLTSKMPVFGRAGDPVGVMGTVQRFEQHRALHSGIPPVAAAVRRMLERPGEIESLRALAAELGLSHRHFDRRFKEETGLTPKQFLGRARVQLGCRLLRGPTTPISDIAFELGYCDQSAFTVQFRQRMGMTPLVYRKQFAGRAVEEEV